MLFRPSLRRAALLSLALMLMTSLIARPSAYAAAPQYFRETQHNLADPMLGYWNAHGGLPVFGFPISEAFNERNADTGATYLTQYLERNRFEAHPENKAPYHVLLGRLGDEALKQQGRDWTTFPKAAPNAPHVFGQTGHAIAHQPFWTYWSTRGLEFDGTRGFSQAESLALFGLPLSEPQMETNSSGDTVLTQWFERARFEDHGAKGVLLGLLGNETTTHRRAEGPFQSAQQGVQPSTPPATGGPAYANDIHAAGMHLFELMNARRQQEFGKAPFLYRDDIQALSDQIAREWTNARKRSNADAQAVLDRYKAQLESLSPAAWAINARVNVPLEAGCQNIDPKDPLTSADGNSYVANFDAKTLTIGVAGPYQGPCGKAMTVVYFVGH